MENELKHFGVLGMRWGIRKDRKKEAESSEDFKKVANLMRKKPHELTNDELSTLTRRLNLEKEFKRLNPSQKDKLKASLSGIFSSTVKPVLLGLAVVQIKGVVEKVLKKK